MKIFSAEQIRQWDQYSIIHEPVAAEDLMERAAGACFRWIMEHCDPTAPHVIVCGSGNNGADGLVIARMLYEARLQVKVYTLKSDHPSDGYTSNFNKLKAYHLPVEEIATEKDFPVLRSHDLVIDALFGTGLNKPLEGVTEKLVQHISASKVEVISIDMPSGLSADQSPGNYSIKATHTLSFQIPKLSFMFASNEDLTGTVHLLDIGLHKDFYQTTTGKFQTIDEALIRSIFKPRKKFTHKYSYGHALLYAGSTYMMGAAILCAKACLRSGAGLITVHAIADTVPILQTSLPEAITSSENDFDTITKKKTVIGIGPGLELSETNKTLLENILIHWKGPLVIDASALHILIPLVQLLSQRKNIPAILTPHAGEFEKLFGKTNNDLERIQLALEKAALHQCYIIVKGHNSLVACPGGEGYFNTTGNSGMATAGSGDVLTGIITGLLAQGYTQKEACIMGVYLHGLAGDLAAEKFSQEAMIAGDIINSLGAAFKIIHKNSAAE